MAKAAALKTTSTSEVTYKTKAEARHLRERKQDIVDRELEILTASLGHVPTSKEVLNAARGPKSVLHRFFEWDDGKAAEAHRLQQAGILLQSSEFIVQMRENGSTRRVAVRRFVLVNKKEPMRLRNEALGDAEAAETISTRAIGELRSWCRRYVDVVQLADIRKEIEQLVP
jgi:hypothetical protein